MKKYKILHIFNDPKFSKAFFEFLIKNKIDINNHFLFHFRCSKSKCHDFGMDTIFSPSFFSPLPNLKMIIPLIASEKIIIHSLASPFLLFYLFLFPELARKSYWVIWGKDLYFYKTLTKAFIHHRVYEFFRKKVIKNIAHIITYSEEDYELAKKWYGSNAILHKSFMYPSNTYKEAPHGQTSKNENTIVILVGNSADPSNNHEEVLFKLEKYKDNNIEVIAPLSYGDMNYANYIAKKGTYLLGKKFVPLKELMPYDEYLNLLSRVDFGIFAHKRQQAMGNITSLLGMGKKVYISNEITTWKLLNELGVKVFNIDDINLDKIDGNTAAKNREIIKNVFSEKNLLDQWKQIESSIP